jgi:hypothetical protein
MTGHEEGSHKKRIKTRLQDTDQKRKQKKQRISEPPTSNAAPPVVSHAQDDVPASSSPAKLLANAPPPVISQTQDNAPASPSFANSPTADVISTNAAVPESPAADHDAVTEMNAGGADETTEGAARATGRLVLFKERVSKKNAAKLTDATVFNHVRQGFVGCEKKGDDMAEPSEDDAVTLNLCVNSLEETSKFRMSSSAGSLVLRWVAQSRLARWCAF